MCAGSKLKPNGCVPLSQLWMFLHFARAGCNHVAHGSHTRLCTNFILVLSAFEGAVSPSSVYL